MATYNKKQLLNELAHTATQQIDHIKNNYRQLFDIELSRSAATCGWSIAQCFKHLNTYNDYYLPLIEKALQTVTTSKQQPTFKSGWLGNLFVKMMENKTIIKKFKAAKQHVPDSELDGRAELEAFIENHERLARLIAACQQVDLTCAMIPLSISPHFKISLGDVLRFLIAHTARHITQADIVRKKIMPI